jgi:hypothetical protein
MLGSSALTMLSLSAQPHLLSAQPWCGKRGLSKRLSQGHDHLNPFIASGRWEGLLIEPLKDYFDSLVRHYAPVGNRLRFANMCVAEEAGKRGMRRLAPAALHPSLLHELGYDGSSSLLAGAYASCFLPPSAWSCFPPDCECGVLETRPPPRSRPLPRVSGVPAVSHGRAWTLNGLVLCAHALHPVHPVHPVHGAERAAVDGLAPWGKLREAGSAPCAFSERQALGHAS